MKRHPGSKRKHRKGSFLKGIPWENRVKFTRKRVNKKARQEGKKYDL